MTYKLPEGRTIRVLYHACAVQKPILSLGRLAQQGTGVTFAQTLEHLFLDKTRRNVATHSCTRKRVCSLSKGRWVAPLTTAGGSDEVAQEIQMPVGPQMLEDVEEPMPARPAALRDPGTPDQIVMEQHNLTHFPSQPWCKVCVEPRGHDSPHREQSKIDAVVPQLQFDYGYMGNGGPLQIACFLVGTDTSSGAIHATMVPDSKKMDVPYVVATKAKSVRDLEYERFCLHGDKEGVLQLLLDKVATECRPEGQDWQILRQVSPTQSHQSNGAAEKAVSTVRGLAETYLAVIKDKMTSFAVTTHSPMLPWTIRYAAWILTRYNVRRDTQ